MSGHALCSPVAPCNHPELGQATDPSEVHGLQGTPAEATVELIEPTEGGETGGAGGAVLDQSYLIDLNINIDASGNPIDEELARNDDNPQW